MTVDLKQLICGCCGSGELVRIDEETSFSKYMYKCKYCKNIWYPTVQEIAEDPAWHRDIGEAFDAYRESDFATARRKFKQLHKQKPQNPTVAWGLLMSEYGISWVENVPTCNWFVNTNIFEQDAYRCVIENCSEEQKNNYQYLAEKIAKNQCEIKEQLKREPDYDVFISFKSKDADNNVTEDSVIAHNIYNKLTERGIRTFFSTVTLKNQIGQKYEPIIYHALSTCKFFILIATSEENINAVWVKNEWERFNYRTKEENLSGACCVVFKNPNHIAKLPRIFKSQGVDLNKYPAGGYEFELADNLSEKLGITKKASTDEEFNSIRKDIDDKLKNIEDRLKKERSKNTSTSSDAPFYDRGMLYLEEKNWDTAKDFFERMLNTNPFHAMSYIGLLLSEKHLKTVEDLNKLPEIDNERNYKMALRFADEDIKKQLLEISNQIKERNNEREYVVAIQNKNANNIESLEQAIAQFTEISSYKDSMKQAEECQKKIFDIQEATRRREWKNHCDKVNRTSKQVGGLEQIKKDLFKHFHYFKQNDVKLEYEAQVCKMYSQKINDLISDGAFSNVNNHFPLTCTVNQYRDLDIAEQNMDYLIKLNNSLVCAMKRNADIRQANIILPKKIDLTDPNLSSWFINALHSIQSLDKAGVFYGSHIIKEDPFSVFSIEEAKYELSSADCEDITKEVQIKINARLRDCNRRGTDLHSYSYISDINEKVKKYLKEHPDAIFTTDTVREKYDSLERHVEYLEEKRQRKFRWLHFSIWFLVVLGGGLCMLIFQPNINGSLTQADYVNKLWSNIWRTVLIIVGGIIAMLILGFIANVSSFVRSFVPKGLSTMLGLYLLFTFKVSSISKGYAVPFYIGAIGCIILTFIFECEGFIKYWNNYRLQRNNYVGICAKNALFYSSYVSLIPIVVLFAYNKAFLILSIPAIWTVTVLLMIFLIVIIYMAFFDLS